VEARDPRRACDIINASSLTRFILPECEMQSSSRSRWENLLESGEKQRLSRIRAIFHEEYVFRQGCRAFLFLGPVLRPVLRPAVDPSCIPRFFDSSRSHSPTSSSSPLHSCRFRDLLSQRRFLCVPHDAASVALCYALPRSLSVCASC